MKDFIYTHFESGYTGMHNLNTPYAIVYDETGAPVEYLESEIYFDSDGVAFRFPWTLADYIAEGYVIVEVEVVEKSTSIKPNATMSVNAYDDEDLF